MINVYLREKKKKERKEKEEGIIRFFFCFSGDNRLERIQNIAAEYYLPVCRCTVSIVRDRVYFNYYFFEVASRPTQKYLSNQRYDYQRKRCKIVYGIHTSSYRNNAL